MQEHQVVMGSIICLILALLAVANAQRFDFNDNNPCYDQVPTCSSMPQSMCTENKEMRRLCPKKCNMCSQNTRTSSAGQRKNKDLLNPDTTTEIFLLYLKNDIKFLKEEISDIKYRVREVIKRQQAHFDQLQKQQEQLNQQGMSDAPPARAPAQAPVRNPQIKIDPKLVEKMQTLNAQMELTKRQFSGEVKELRTIANTLSQRIKDQHETIMQMARNMTNDIMDVRNENAVKFKSIDDEILNLDKELKKATNDLDTMSKGKLQSSAKIGGDIFADFKLESQRRQYDLQQSTTQAIGQLTNFTNKMAKQFMNSQQEFFNLLEQEREKTFNLETQIANLTYNIQLQARKRMEEATAQGSQPALGFDPKETFDTIMEGVRENQENINSEREKLRMVASMISGLRRNLTNVKEEAGKSKSYLAYQYQYIVENIRELMPKLQAVEKNSNEVMNKTMEQLKRQNRNKGEDNIFHLTKKLRELTSKVQELQDQQARLMQAAQSKGNDDTAVSMPPVSGPVNSNVEASLNEIKSAMKRFRETFEADKGRISKFGVTLKDAVNFTKVEVTNMKSAILRMAEMRNNESVTQEDIRDKYQRGIFQLLGRQRSNKTQFFNPRFDFKDDRLSIYGLVAIHNEGEWGTICDDNFDDREANVICRMAGYRGGVYDEGKYKVGDGMINGVRRPDYRIWVDELECKGTEQQIQDCTTGSDGWGMHDCDHGEDVGIKCFIS